MDANYSLGHATAADVERIVDIEVRDVDSTHGERPPLAIANLFHCVITDDHFLTLVRVCSSGIQEHSTSTLSSARQVED